jgi:hypothetical protein
MALSTKYFRIDFADRLFGGRRVFIWAFMAMVIGAAIGFPQWLPCCSLIFDPVYYTWEYDPYSDGGVLYGRIELGLMSVVG